jgi:hypothetical protein
MLTNAPSGRVSSVVEGPTVGCRIGSNRQGDPIKSAIEINSI